MLQNYIKTAFRSLLKQRIYTLINVAGLAVSIVSCLLIVLYVKHETSYDTFFPEGDRVYKVTLERKYPNHSTYFASIPHSYAGVMLKDFPEVENTLQVLGPNRDLIVTYKLKEGESKVFEENDFLFADSTFFTFFDMPFIKGDKKTALNMSNQVVISSSTAKRYFGDEDPLGKTIKVFDDYKVTGVFEDLPDNSHLKFDFVASFAGAEFRKAENFISFDSQTYIKLKPGSDWKALESKFPAMVDRYASGQIERELGQSWEDYQKAGNGYRYFLQPLTSIHLDPTNIEFTITPSGNRKYVYSLTFIAVLILVIACINFMNLATARSAERAREVGVRKVMGSLKNQLVTQFLVEATLLTFTGTLIAVAAAYFLLPTFNTLVEKNLHLVFTPDVVLGLTGFALLVGVLAGIYPAFVLSAYNPVIVMKGNFTAGAKGTWLRNGLVVFQFMISIVLIVGTLVVGRQMKFMQNKDLGFDKSAVMMVGRAWNLDKKQQTFIDEVKQFPGVISAAATSSRVGNRDDVFGQMFQPEGSNEVLTVKSMILDDEFAQNIGFELKEGRFFSKDTNDSLHILLNETAVKTIGLKDPVGQKLSNTDLFRGDPKREGQRFFTVIGVIKNFHFQSLRDEITPLVAFNREIFGKFSNSQYVAIRVEPDKVQQVIPKVQAKWNEMVENKPFRYEFLEDNLNQGYAEEQRSGKLFRVFSGLAIIIACVGLFGLSAYTASLRTREIGIRKVMGASVGSVVMLLSKDFTRLVIVSFVLATPLSWWMMDTWLNGFAYRVSLGVDAFLIAGVIALLIAGLTVSYQSIKAAVVNPVKSLKSE